MPRSLTELILEARAIETPYESQMALRPEHAVAAGDAALLVLAAFAATGRAVARVEVALVCADSRTALEALGGTGLQEAAMRAGARFAPPALGRAARVHLERFAAPTRLALGCAAGLAGSGGVGTLALSVGALELAAAWAGAPHVLERARVVRVALEGALAEGVSAVDLMLALAVSARAAALRGCVVEFGGPGVGAVPVEERIAAASLAPALGALAVLWPADEATRTWMAARGRESEWKRAGAEPDAWFDRAVDLGALEPCAVALAPVAAVPVHDAGALPVAVVVLGPGTPPGALARLARALGGRAVPPPATLVVGPGRREWAAPLAALGPGFVHVVEPGEAVPAAVGTLAGAAGLYFGTEVGELPGPAAAWRLASPETCIASALAGRLEDGRGAPWLTGEEPAPVPLAGAVLEPAAGAGAGAPAGLRALALPAPPGSSARGLVLLDLGDDRDAEDVLLWGPRLRPLLGDLEALAAHACEDLDPTFAARARAAGGGFLVAGERCGAGRVRDSAVLALAALGVHAVLARSFAPAFARGLAAAGVLPLVLAPGAERPAAADELELPGLAEALAAGRAITVRNLSRGHGYTARLELPPHEAAMARAGGRLRALGPGD